MGHAETPRAGAEGDWQMFEAEYEVSPSHRRRGVGIGKAEIVHAVEQDVKKHSHLETGELRAEAEVAAVTTECDVRVRRYV